VRLLLFFVFVLSGAAGLMYESIWARYLGLFVGHAAYAQILTIGIFLGGMALGAILIGRRSESLKDPLKWYALVELAAGVIGLFFHEFYAFTTEFAYESLFPALGTGFGLTLAKWIVAGALILPQSVLLGTTFPLMAAGVLRRYRERPGGTLAILYFSNSLGAAAGVLVAGFYLLRIAGLPGTLLAAAMLNLVAAAVSWAVAARSTAGEALPEAPEAGERVAEAAAGLRTRQLVGLLLGVSFGTAVASFIYEIAWLRMLSLVLGSATHSFELMLSAFILGLALGSFWVRRRADQWKRPLQALGIVQWIMGISALATLPLYGQSFFWMADLMQAFARTDGGYQGFTVARYAICLAVMLPSTFCAGITLPLITRTLLTHATGERAIGSVYGVNTLGSIVGVGLAGLILMPLLGVRLLLVVGAALDMAIGVGILIVAARATGSARRLAHGAAWATVAVVLVAGLQGEFDRYVLASGVFRHGNRPRAAALEILVHEDGRTATVTTWREGSTIAIATNGKVDGSLPESWLSACSDSTPRRALLGDASTQSLAPLIALAHVPNARLVAVIGQGTGMSSDALLASPVLERLVTIEIEPEMIRASRAFYPANGAVFDDPRSEIVIEDARTYLASAGEPFDLIVSEPSNPWVSGVASLFTSEFYGRAARWLSDDGVFAQWVQLYELTDGLALSVLAGLEENFGAYEVFLTGFDDMLIVATKADRLPAPDWSIFSAPGIQEHFCHAVAPTAESLEGTRLMHDGVLAPLLHGWGQPNSDFYPVLDLGAERARYRQELARGFTGFATERVDLGEVVSLRRVEPAQRANVPMGSIPRVYGRALAAGLRDPSSTQGVDTAGVPKGLPAARYRELRWNELLAAPQGPDDWRDWVDDLREVERDRHTGTSGFVDEEFYWPVLRYLDRFDAPDEARLVVAFYRALAGWDFAVAAQAADTLLDRGAEKKGWIARNELLEGAVVANLRVGDVATARRMFSLLVGDARGNGGLRLRLLGAYVAAMSNGLGE